MAEYTHQPIFSVYTRRNIVGPIEASDGIRNIGIPRILEDRLRQPSEMRRLINTYTVIDSHGEKNDAESTAARRTLVANSPTIAIDQEGRLWYQKGRKKAYFEEISEAVEVTNPQAYIPTMEAAKAYARLLGIGAREFSDALDYRILEYFLHSHFVVEPRPRMRVFLAQEINDLPMKL